MCHWVLRIWKCGDSFFTKHSSCSFDRATYDPTNLLNPLHSSITSTPVDRESTTRSSKRRKESTEDSTKSPTIGKYKRPSNGKREKGTKKGPDNKGAPRSTLPPIDLSMPGNTHTTLAADGSKVVYPRNPKTGETLPIPVSEIGKASRFGDMTLKGGKCNVFEVVLQSKEETMCPACARSEKRAKLPAYARGCFGLS